PYDKVYRLKGGRRNDGSCWRRIYFCRRNPGTLYSARNYLPDDVALLKNRNARRHGPPVYIGFEGLEKQNKRSYHNRRMSCIQLKLNDCMEEVVRWLQITICSAVRSSRKRS